MPRPFSGDLRWRTNLDGDGKKRDPGNEVADQVNEVAAALRMPPRTIELYMSQKS